MAQDDVSTYRTPADSATPNDLGDLREVLGRTSVPLLGDVDAEPGLGKSLHLEVDRQEVVVRPGSGLLLRAEELPDVHLRELRVDLVQGVVRTEAAALGAFFDRVLTVGLCSVLRQALGWQPGGSAVDHAARRLGPPLRGGALPVWGGRGFPRASLGVHPQTRLSLGLSG